MENILKTAPIIISLIAILLSVFTFYWTILRNKKSFYLIRLDGMHGELVSFSLINSGTKDILVTNMQLGLRHIDKMNTNVPNQEIKFKEKDSLLVEASKAYTSKIVQIENIKTKEYLEDSILKEEHRICYCKDLVLFIDWIDLEGKQYHNICELSRFKIYSQENGSYVFSSGPLQKTHNLYSSGKYMGLSNK